VGEHLGPRCSKYDGYKVFVKLQQEGDLTYSAVMFSNVGFVAILANFTEDRTVPGRDAVSLLEQSLAFRWIVMPPSSGSCSPETSLLHILSVPVRTFQDAT
jgi:hypothetical protein